MRGEMWAGREGVGRRRRKRHARGGPDSRLGARARAERTVNMRYIFVTLDVSKLSGWLNAVALCRVARWAYDARAVCGGAGASGIAGKGFRLEAGARART